MFTYCFVRASFILMLIKFSTVIVLILSSSLVWAKQTILIFPYKLNNTDIEVYVELNKGKQIVSGVKIRSKKPTRNTELVITKADSMLFEHAKYNFKLKDKDYKLIIWAKEKQPYYVQQEMVIERTKSKDKIQGFKAEQINSLNISIPLDSSEQLLKAFELPDKINLTHKPFGRYASKDATFVKNNLSYLTKLKKKVDVVKPILDNIVLHPLNDYLAEPVYKLQYGSENDDKLYPIEFNSNKNFASRYTVDPLSLLYKYESLEYDEIVATKGYKKLLNRSRAVAEKIKPYHLKNLRLLLTSILSLLFERGDVTVCSPFKIDGVRYTLEAFSKDFVVLDCDTMVFSLVSILYRIQKKYPSHNVLGRLYYVALPDHVLMAVKDANHTFKYFDVNIAPVSVLLSGLTFKTKKEYVLSARRYLYLYDNDTFRPIKDLTLEVLIKESYAQHLRIQDKHDASDKMMLNLMKKFPNQPNIRHTYTLFNLVLDNREQEAIDYYIKISKHSKLDYYDVRAWEMAYMRTNQFQKALALINKYIASNPKDFRYYELRDTHYSIQGMKFRNDGDMKKSEAYYQLAEIDKQMVKKLKKAYLKKHGLDKG